MEEPLARLRVYETLTKFPTTKFLSVYNANSCYPPAMADADSVVQKLKLEMPLSLEWCLNLDRKELRKLYKNGSCRDRIF